MQNEMQTCNMNATKTRPMNTPSTTSGSLNPTQSPIYNGTHPHQPKCSLPTVLRQISKIIKLDKNSKIVLDDNRLLQEIVIYMEKKDINEEIIRLRSHIHVFADSLNRGKIEKGKRMTFLLQEFLREINTIGSKTDNVEVSHLAVNIKSEIEKIREQVQNIL